MKKAQAAIEFLITYGWAFLIIFGVIGVLSYTGVFNFNQFVVEKCDFMSGVYCTDGIATSEEVTLLIRNGLPIDIDEIKLYIEECGTDSASGPGSLLTGDEGVYIMSCSLSKGTILNSGITLNYTNTESGFNHTKIGKIIYRVDR